MRCRSNSLQQTAIAKTSESSEKCSGPDNDSPPRLASAVISGESGHEDKPEPRINPRYNVQVLFGVIHLSGPEVNCDKGTPSRSEKDSTSDCGEGYNNAARFAPS